jgi:hypothetical protein
MTCSGCGIEIDSAEADVAGFCARCTEEETGAEEASGDAVFREIAVRYSDPIVRAMQFGIAEARSTLGLL